MQQGGGVPIQPQYGAPTSEMTPPATAALGTHMLLAAGTDQSQQQQLVEEASPISSRPPAAAGNLDEFMRLSGSGDEADRAEGVASSNRWPRQETLALIQIRSDMDAAFREATVKGPLWEDVSRKLAELGYKRSAKKCREKFENVDKYYKRTKEGRAGRQDGKSYRFFSQLEALHNSSSNTSTTTLNLVTASQPIATTITTLDVAPVSIGIPMPVLSVRLPPSTVGMSSSSTMFPPDLTVTMAPAVAAPPRPSAGISFSSTSNGSSSSASSQEDDEDDYDDDKPSNIAAGPSRKRKRHSSKGGTRRMMESFEGLMKHVMQKQEAMQQRFLEAIEKREHDRMIREEAWKRQEIARQNREQELVAQERASYASRDAAIIAFLQKITGQTIQLPSPVTIAAVPQPAPPPQPQPVSLAPVVTVSIQQPPAPQPQAQPHSAALPQQYEQQQHQQVHHQQSSISSEVAMTVVPEQEVPPQEIGNIGSLEPTSSRWPKAEVLALIKLRSGLDSRYQEAGPKGPLWEEISAGMHRMGYKRSSKRCKEKWENINKYFKKVKESNKKRPEDAKTCPYFHELDALYRKKILGSSSGGGGGYSTTSSGFANLNRPEEQQQQESMTSDPLPPTKPESRSEVSATVLAQTSESQTKIGGGADVNTVLPGSLFGEGNGGSAQKGMQRQQQKQLMLHECEKMDEGDDSDNTEDDEDGVEVVGGNEEDDDDDDGDEYDERPQEERKMAYKIEFQRQNTNASRSNGGENGTPTFLAMV
ncbi:trihelix transcription factor GTL1 isoform X2 [Hevea brasiliensis]|uniref:trihelix transcription factor GTL1 isoform X2 n=1 Tax=Hevea brasiliensis TaxID=3981 RepID=UPI0025CCA0D7|nr:trihelix transcription factor GTL1 isoform X2 [Hevea brasiliensis]